MNANNFVCKLDSQDFFKDVAEDTETRFDTSEYSKDDNMTLSIRENKKVIGMPTDKLN